MNNGLTRFTRVAMIVALVAMVALMIGAPSSYADDWKGKQTKKDGVTWVENPAKGMESPTTIKMEELWRLGGDTDDEDEFFGVIADAQIDDEGNVYLLDSQLAEVKIYTMDGEYIRSIGREGEGPGEFRMPTACFFTKDGNIAVLQMMPGKIVILTKDGEPAGEHPLPQTEDGGFQILSSGRSGGNNLVLLMARQEFADGRWARTSFLASVDPDGAQLAEYHSKTNEIIMANAVMDDAAWDTIERRWTVGPDGRVWAATLYDDYQISVWNADGTSDRVITREYTHRPRTSDEKEFMGKMMGHFAQMMPGCEVKIHDNTKDIETFYVRDDGSVWVLTSNGARDNPDNTLGVFDVFDSDGRFVRQMTLEGEGDSLDDLYLFVKDRVYVVTEFLQAAMSAQGVSGLYDEEDEPEPMTIICYKLEGDLLSAR